MKKLLFVSLLKARPWLAVYEGEGGEGGSGEGGSGDGGKGGEGGGSNNGGGGDDEDKPKFSQKQLNKILADDRRKHEDRVKAHVAQLEELKKSKTISEKEREKLSSQIEDLQNSLLTKDEQTKKEKEKLDKQHKEQVGVLTEEKDFWQREYATESTRNQILMASQTHKAVSSEQMTDFLMPKTRLVELVGEDGKGTRKFVPKVKLRTLNDKSEEIELDLTIEEAVKRMKDEPERFGNLFESGVQGGLGGGGSSGGSLIGDKPPADPTQYRQWRKTKGLTRRV